MLTNQVLMMPINTCAESQKWPHGSHTSLNSIVACVVLVLFPHSPTAASSLRELWTRVAASVSLFTNINFCVFLITFATEVSLISSCSSSKLCLDWRNTLSHVASFPCMCTRLVTGHVWIYRAPSDVSALTLRCDRCHFINTKSALLWKTIAKP